MNWLKTSMMYSFFSDRITLPWVVNITMAHSTKYIAVIGTETMRQKPDLISFFSLN